MRNFLSSTYSALSTTTKELSGTAINDQVAAFAKRLNDRTRANSTIRLWVEDGSSFGHQSSTVHVMYRIAKAVGDDKLNLGYQGTIELYYTGSDELKKLYDLIPEMKRKPEGKVGEAKVKLIDRSVEGNLPTESVTFGATGGSNVGIDYATTLQVENFLRLQPYGWDGPEQIQFLDSSKDTVELDRVPEVGASRFKRRLYYMDKSMYETVPWGDYLDRDAPYTPAQKNKLSIVKDLFGDATLKDYQVQAAYSIKTGSHRFNQNTTYAAAVIVAGALEWQKRDGKLYKNAKPVIIVNFDEFGEVHDSSESDLKTVLQGGFAKDESMLKNKYEKGTDADLVANVRRRQDYFKNLKAVGDEGGNRFSFLNYPTSLEEVQAAVRKISGVKDAVLFVQLGRSFPAAFSYALFRSLLPPIFEGQNTTNLAVNIGRAYLQVPATNMTTSDKLRIYPSVTLAEYSSQQVPAGLLSVAGQISSSPAVWPTMADSAPPVVLGSYYRQYTDERPGRGTITTYFAKVKEFFATPTQDKLLVAGAYLNSLLPSESTDLEASDADSNPLNALYDKIAAAVAQDKTVDLVPSIMTDGAFPAFIQSFLKDFSGGLTLTVKTFEPAEKPTKVESIKLVGPTDAFEKIGVESEVTIDFTAPDDKLVADVKFTAEEKWSMPDAPWMVFDRPFISLTIPHLGLPTSATIGGFYPALEQGSIVAELEISIGGADGRWPASIDFGKPPNTTLPGIASAYQMATGLNIVRSLPAPFNVLTDIGIQRVEVEYDEAKKNVDSIAIVARSNTRGLPLVGAVELDEIVITAVVLEPTSSRTLVLGVSAEFKLGESATVTISFNYPDIVLQGTLSSGTPTFSDVLVAFVPEMQGLSLPFEPTLEAFSFMYNKPTDYLTVSVELKMDDWGLVFPFPSGPKTLFSLDSVEFGVTRNKGVNTGNLSAHTKVMSIGVDVGAEYLANSDLKFTANTTTVVDIDQLITEYLGESWVPDTEQMGLPTLPKLEDVSVEMLWGKDGGAEAKAQSFEFKAKTAEPWQPIPALGADFAFTFDLTLGYGPKKKSDGTVGESGGAESSGGAPDVIEAHLVGEEPSTALVATDDGDTNEFHGKIAATATLWNIHLGIEFEFSGTKEAEVCVTWTDVGLRGCVKKQEDGDTVAVFGFTEDQTLGGIIEKFVSWATGTPFGLMAPFNVLDDISLSGLEVTYNFTKKKVDFTIKIGPIDLGLFTINGITLAYNPEGNPQTNGERSRNKVEITIDGSFLWDHTADNLKWEPDDPSTTPAPPGGGSKYFDLRLLALGQHVTVDGLVEQTNVAEVIAMLEKLDIPQPPEIPIGGANQPRFDPTSSWFIAFDFGILKVEEKKDDGGATASAAIPSSTGDAGAIVPAASAAGDGDDKPATYFISLAIVFNDPHVYALRIALEGPMAKIFAGLDFQIMYQQVSKNVGKYSAQIALPSIMRKFQIGVASITLPVFGIEIYTNGDFQVDIGFPWKQDFSRSFSIEVQVGYFPVLGSAGFYFGKLSSATTNKVPKTDQGWFNPVIVFGFGAQIGLGKSIEAGILRAGFSVTVFGIIEGVIARWHPYELTTGENKNSLQDGYYFALTGTFGLQGRLYGSINFAIISAELDVRISIYVQIRFASYEPIDILAAAHVSVTLTVKINLGLFKISIHLSFKATVKVEFELKNPMGGPEDAPWAPKGLTANAASPMAELSAARRLAARRRAKGASADAAGVVAMSADLFAMSANADTYAPVWDNLQPGTQLRVNGWVAPVLTVAGDGAMPTRDRPADPGKQKVCYVLNFFVQSEKPIHTTGSDDLEAQSAAPDAVHAVAPEDVAQVALERARSEPLTAQSAEDYTDKFEDLAERVVLWVIAAGKSGSQTTEQVRGDVADDDFLGAALSYLSGSTSPTPVPIAEIEKFLAAQVKVLFNLEKGDKADPDPPSAVFFPAAPAVTLAVPALGGVGPFNYPFGGYNSSSSGFLTQLNDYFNALKVQVQEDEQHDGGLDAQTAPTFDGPSIGTYIFGDYFAMIGRLMLQAMRDGLRNFKLPIVHLADKTVNETVADINDKMRRVDGGAAPSVEPYTVPELFAANQKHHLDPAAATDTDQGIAIAGMRWQSPGGKSFADVAAEDVFKGGFGASPFDATALALANAKNATIIAAGVELAVGDEQHRTQTGDSLTTIADALKVTDVAALLTAEPTLLTGTDVLATQSILDIPQFRHKVVATDTLLDVAEQYAIDIDALAGVNGDVANLFGTDDGKSPNLDVPHLVQFQVGELLDEMKRTLALQNLGASASRYYLHGLRLPTEFPSDDGVRPNYDGLFVEKGGKYPADLGLFALTGQAIELPDIADTTSGYELTVDSSAERWASLGADGETSVTFTLTNALDFQRYDGVRKAAATYLDTGSRNIGPLDVSATKPGRYPLATEIPWQPAVAVTLPVDPATPATPKPRMWQLPTELINTPNGSGMRPVVTPVVARSDEATGTTVDEPVGNYGFGTLVTFKVRRLDSDSGTAVTKRTYEIIGAPESEVALMERLLDQLQDDPATFDQLNLFYRPRSTGSDSQGWQSDDPTTSLMGISQTNLSTTTRPGGIQASAAEAVEPLPNVIGTPNAFIRLLWEASITRQGGFYLSYTSGIGGDKVDGVPDHAFNDKNEAELAVVALFAPGSDVGQSLGNYMNVVATDEPFDLSDAALVAEAVPVDVPTPRDFLDTDTLVTYAASYYTGTGVLAEQNAGVAFAAGVEVTVVGGVYQVPPNPTGATPRPEQPYGDLGLIAQHFSTDTAAIRKVNQSEPGLPDTMDAYTAIKLPTVTVPSSGQSFTKLSQYFAAPIADLAAANEHVAGLFSKQPLTVSTGPASLAPTVKRGISGMTLQRTMPIVPDDPGGDWAVQYLRSNFSLLGYRVSDNPQNPYFPESNWGLPSGPIDPDAKTAADKIQVPVVPSADQPWDFRFGVPYSKVLAKGKQDASPYLGLGDLLQFELVWLDIFGNKILTELDTPTPAAGAPLQGQPQLTGYTDRLVGVGQWPSVANAYTVKAVEDVPTLEVELDFDPTAYEDASAALAGDDESAKQSAKERIEQGIAAYTLVLQQLNDPAGVSSSLRTSLTPGVSWPPPTGDDKPRELDGLTAWATRILDYLTALLPDPNKSRPTAEPAPPAAYTYGATLDPNQVSDDQIFKLTVTLSISRRTEMVNGELATVAGVGEAATTIAPKTGSLTTNTERTGDDAKAGDDEKPIQRTITNFAREFTKAFGTTGGRSLRIATGPDRTVFTGAEQGPLWVVELGLTGQRQPISYTIADANDPTVYAPRPISNKLCSKSKTPIIEYETGSVIELNGPSEDRAFTSIDLDKWMGTTLAAIDRLLTPRYTAPAEILHKNIENVPPASPSTPWPDALQEVLDAKEALAKNLQTVMIAVYTSQHPGQDQLDGIREEFFQSMLEKLGNFYNVKAGVQFEADVIAAIKRRADAVEVPRLFGDIKQLPLQAELVASSDPGTTSSDGQKISVSSPKLDLEWAPEADDGDANDPGRYLSSLVSTTTFEKKVDLNLEYEGQYIEHEIGKLAGIDGYQPSSWLSFVDIEEPESTNDSGDDPPKPPEFEQPLTVPLGQFPVPIVLREFPPTPTLVNQDAVPPPSSPCYQPLPADDSGAGDGPLLSGIECLREGDYDPLAAATRWNYRFTYSLQVHEEQDEVCGEISFNIEDDSALLAADAPERDIFDNLAQFTQVYPKVLADLDQYLVPIDVGTTDPDTLKNAQAALGSAAAMICWLASSPPKVDDADVLTASAATTSVGFKISEDSVEIDGVDELRITLTLDEVLPPRVGTPFVQVDLEGYVCEIHAHDDPLTTEFVYKDGDTYLPAQRGRTVPGRTLVLPDMDVLERQDAQTAVHILRNVNLVSGKTIAEPFVYTTPTVSFDNPLHPTVVVDEAINLATIFSTGPDDPQQRTLGCQLSLMYQSLFANAGTADVTMQMGMYYEYEINAAIEPVRLPVYLMPPTKTAITSGGQGRQLGDVVKMQVSGWTAWYDANTPETEGGRLVIDLTVMSDLTAQPMPILHLTGLYVPHKDLA